MNLDRNDWENFQSIMLAAINHVQKIWVDNDYTHEMDNKSELVKSLNELLEDSRKFFCANEK